MTGADRYAGLSRRERSTVAIAVGIALPLALIAFRPFAQGAVPTIIEPPTALKIFDVPPPPPPPPPAPMPTRTPMKPVPRQKIIKPAAEPGSLHRTRDHPSDSGGRPAIAEEPIAPIFTAAIQPIALVPATGTVGLLGSDGSGVGAGAGAGGRKGDGDGGGGGAPRQPRLTAADWVRPPSRADFLREWPKNGRALKVPVHVVLVCDVRKGGRPSHCIVVRESLAGLGFGTAAVRLTEESLVHPVLVDGHRTDRQVVVPLSFLPADAKSVVPGAQGRH